MNSRKWVCQAALALATVVCSNASLAEPSEGAGAALFLRGEGAELELAGSGVKLPATRFPCARCHGEDGRGSREGGTLMPPIVWSQLIESTTKRPAYDSDALLSAITHGIDTSGRRLSEVMPRYSTSPETLNELVRYLQQLESEQQIGISANEVRITAPVDPQRRAGFIAAIQTFNAEGGSYGRQVVVAEKSDTDSSDKLLNADAMFMELADELPGLLRKSLLVALREDGRQRLSLSSGVPDAALEYELRRAGLTYDADSPVLFIDDAAQLKKAGKIGDLQARVLYTSYLTAGPDLSDYLSSDKNFVLAGIGEPAVRWAVQNAQGEEGAHGYLLGMLLQKALLSSGRNITHASVKKQFAMIDLSKEVFIMRSEQQSDSRVD